MPLREHPQPLHPELIHLREKIFLAAQAAEGNLHILPGKTWALYYSKNRAARNERLKGLLEGKLEPTEEIASGLRPQALIYNTDDLNESFETVSGRIRDMSARVAYYDYKRFVEFVASMKGREVDVETVQALYDGISNSRIRKKLLDAYGFTGRNQLEDAMRQESQATVRQLPDLLPVQRVLEALKLDWMCDDLKFVSPENRDLAVSQLTEDEKQAYDSLKTSYRKFVQSGDQSSYETLVNTVRESLSLIRERASESMEKLREELKTYQKQVGLPGSPQDPAIPPDDKDEYHTPPPSEPGESNEAETAIRPIFEITPSGTSKAPLTGNYCTGRKSYFNLETKTWSKRKQLTPYEKTFGDSERQTISGVLDVGLKSLPIPNHYALDSSSLNFTGSQPKIFRDQNGCFYLESEGTCQFSIDFLREDPPFITPPIDEDTNPLYHGLLSDETEVIIAGLHGDAPEKAELAREYLLSRHYYPGDGDAIAAQALQHKLRSESNADNYLQTLDASEYLECYSANTLFIAMMRKAGIPARLVFGHRVESVAEGKASINANTGHAWAEIWDGNLWRRFDATPRAKPEDKKKSQKEREKQEKKGGSPMGQPADDDGMEQPPSEEELTDEVKDKVQERAESIVGHEPGEASNSDFSEADENLKKAQRRMNRMQMKQRELERESQESNSFRDFKDVRDKVDQEELLPDMKAELEEKIDAKEKQKKEEIQDRIEQMTDDGFLDEEKRDRFEDQLQNKDLEKLESLMQEIERESNLYDQYEAIREEVNPLVEEWFRYFADHLPRENAVEFDEDSLTRQGAFNRKSVMKPRNLLFGTVKNPRVQRPDIKPRFIASILVDVSGSMAGEKLENARKLLVFYSELFARISQVFGYIRFSINIFSDTLTEIKAYNHDYGAPMRYSFSDGESETVKVRLMRAIQTQGGTNMLDAIRKAARDLNEEKFEYLDYVSALYCIGDGGDTCGNAGNIRNFLRTNEAENGFGEHLLSAILLGDESQRQTLAAIFGDEHTSVAPNFEELIKEAMEKFDDDISSYLQGMNM